MMIISRFREAAAAPIPCDFIKVQLLHEIKTEPVSPQSCPEDALYRHSRPIAAIRTNEEWVGI